MRKLVLAATIAVLAGGAATAQSAIAIQKSVYLERAERQGDRLVRALEPATTLRRGDTVVLMLKWNAPVRSGNFAVTTPVPRDLSFKRTGGQSADVSIDGGRSWGRLTELNVGGRRATPEDVTHLRWQVGRGQARRGTGTLSYSAIVR